MVSLFIFFFFFSSRRRHTRFSRDWSSDVCSSDLHARAWHLSCSPDLSGTAGGRLTVVAEPHPNPLSTAGGEGEIVRLTIIVDLRDQSVTRSPLSGKAEEEAGVERRGGS